MDHLDDFSDERNRIEKIFCPYCGEVTEPKNREHIPPRVFLDKPYPAELPIIYPCADCNEGFSLDEEYVACLVECICVDSVDIEKIGREKIKRALEHSPHLASRLDKEIKQLRGGKAAKRVSNRIKKIMIKLARGHVAFEYGALVLNKPSVLECAALTSLNQPRLQLFETPPRFSLLAEVGTRAMQRQVQTPTGAAEWIMVQPGRYRYLTLLAEKIEIRFVLSEYLACRVEWDKWDFE